MYIAFIIPFTYKWDNYSTVRAHYDYLKIFGHKVDLLVLNHHPKIIYNKYDQVWLMGSQTALNRSVFEKIKVPVLGFGLSDPNMFSDEHMKNCDIYFTNDLETARTLRYQKEAPDFHYYAVSCDKRYHKNLSLKKTIPILVYGAGSHKFITNRNQTVNFLRKVGFKITVYGNGWDRHPDTHGFIEGGKFIEVINRSHLLLDLANKYSAFAHRIMEGSACGTPVMTLYREDTINLFVQEREILTYLDMPNLIFKLSLLFEMPETLKRVGLAGQKRCYEQHDISVKMPKLLKYLEGIKK